MCHHVDKVELLEECLDLCVEEQGLLEATWENPDGKTEVQRQAFAHTFFFIMLLQGMLRLQ